jgi:hypothetical protein
MAKSIRGTRSRGPVRVRTTVLGALTIASTLAAWAPAQGQQRPPARRRQAPIEIRGQVPTPQVVTVRPREVPSYSRQVLVPRFYDQDFWPDIEEGYVVVSDRLLTGLAADSAALAMGNVGTPDLFRQPDVGVPVGLASKYGHARRQYRWCATRFWCPTHRVKIAMPADSATLLTTQLKSSPGSVTANGANGATGANASRVAQVPQEKSCGGQWWCPPSGTLTTPEPTTPTAADPNARVAPAPGTPPRQPAGTPPASRSP